MYMQVKPYIDLYTRKTFKLKPDFDKPFQTSTTVCEELGSQRIIHSQLTRYYSSPALMKELSYNESPLPPKFP
jgi:hypothetical protein